MIPSELHDAWTRLLDGDELSSEELQSVSDSLPTLLDDTNTDALLRAVAVADSTDLDSARFAQLVNERLQSAQAATTVQPPQASSATHWTMLAVAAALLLIVGASVFRAMRSGENVASQPGLSATNEPVPTPTPEQSPTTELAVVDPAPESTSVSEKDGVIQRAPESTVENKPTEPTAIASNTSDPQEVVPPEMTTPKFEPPAQRSVETPRNSLARLTSSANAIWQGGEPESTDLSAGPLALLSGQIDLVLSEGTELKLTGPLEMDLLSANKVALRAGTLEANVPARAIGFEVQIPGARIVDLGTRFKVTANLTEAVVEVTEGTVELIQPQGRGGRGEKLRLTAGRMQWLSYDGVEMDDWRMVVQFGSGLNANQVAVDGKIFDINQGDQWLRCMRSIIEKFQVAYDQLSLITKGKRFEGLLVVDNAPFVINGPSQLKTAQATLVKRIQNSWNQAMFKRAFPRGLPDETSEFFREHGFPFRNQ